MTAPAFPDPASVKARLLADMLRGLALTSLDAWRRHSTSRAAALVEQLRKAGFPVRTRLISVETADNGRLARVALYSLPCEFAPSLGVACGDFLSEVAAARRAA